MLTKMRALPVRRLTVVVVLLAAVAIGAGVGVFRATPVEAECFQVSHKNSTSGRCTWGAGPCRFAEC